MHEFLNVLHNSDNPDFNAIAKKFETFELLDPNVDDIIDEGEVTDIVPMFTANTMEVVNYLRDNPEWIKYGSGKGAFYRLAAFNEDNHVSNQSVELYKDYDNWTLSVNCGFVYDRRDCEHYHGEENVMFNLGSVTLLKAKKMAIELLMTKILPKNLLQL